MKRLARYHKVPFTGLMNLETKGEWCKWNEVEDLIMDHRLEELEMSEDYIKRRACYRNCYFKKLKVSLLVNLLFLILLVGV